MKEVINLPVKNIEEEEYHINMGPQHPSTHGVLRLVVSLQGEMVKSLKPHCGYIHRGIEKMCEKDTYPQIIHLTDRMDYLSAHINNHAVCLLVEKALEVDVPRAGKIYPDDHGRTEPNRLSPVVVVQFRDGPGRVDRIFLWSA